ncbi:RAP domain-containing protein [Chlorella vulgaris]
MSHPPGDEAPPAQHGCKRAPYHYSNSPQAVVSPHGSRPAGRQTVYGSLPKLRLDLGPTEKRGREPDSQLAGTPPSLPVPPQPPTAGTPAEVEGGGNKRPRLAISRVTPDSARTNFASPRSAASSPRCAGSPCADGGAGQAAQPLLVTPVAGRSSLEGNGQRYPGSPALGGTSGSYYPASPAPGGQWVWRPDAPSPQGPRGAWVWQESAPLPPPPPPPPVPPAKRPGFSPARAPLFGGSPHRPLPPPPGYHAHPGQLAPPSFNGRQPPYLQQQQQHLHSWQGQQQFRAPYQHVFGQQYQHYQQFPGAHQHYQQGQQGQQQHRPGPVPARPFGPSPGPRNPALAAAIKCNKRITSATSAREIFEVVEQEHAAFDSVCLATAMHSLANLKGAPNLHAQIAQAPQFFKLKHLIFERRSEFTARNLANTLWALASINHHPGDEFLAGMAAEVQGKARDGNAQNIANMFWAFATLGFHPGDEVLQALAEAARQKLGESTAQNISNTVLALAKLEFDPGDELLEGLSSEALRKIKSFTPQALANTLWGLSKLGIKAEGLMEGIGQAAHSQIYDYNSQNLANSVWAYANIDVNPGEASMEEFARVAMLKMPEFSPQNISNFCWAFARLGVRNEDLFAEAGKHAARIMHIFTPQSIANLLWSYATLDLCPEASLLHVLRGQVLKLVGDFSPQNLSNTAWALATLKDHDAVRSVYPGLLGAIAEEVKRRLLDPTGAATFSRQHLANFVWAAATVDYDLGSRTLMCIAEALVSRADLCNPQEVSNSVWAFAKLSCYDGKLMEAMAAEATRSINNFSQQNLANLAWAFSKLAHFDEPLMAAIAGRAEALVKDLNLQHCTILIWSYCRLKWSTSTLIPTLVAELKSRMAEAQFNQQQLCNVLWSLCIADQCDREIWDLCIDQVFQCAMLMLAQAPDAEWPLPEELLRLGMLCWMQRAKVVTEWIAMEVDGPHHFTANTFRPLADTEGRRLLLRARGWRVVSVPFYHWYGEDDETRRSLLQRLLREARAQPVPPVHAVQTLTTARLQALCGQQGAGLPQPSLLQVPVQRHQGQRTPQRRGPGTSPHTGIASPPAALREPLAAGGWAPGAEQGPGARSPQAMRAGTAPPSPGPRLLPSGPPSGPPPLSQLQPPPGPQPRPQDSLRRHADPPGGSQVEQHSQPAQQQAQQERSQLLSPTVLQAGLLSPAGPVATPSAPREHPAPGTQPQQGRSPGSQSEGQQLLRAKEVATQMLQRLSAEAQGPAQLEPAPVVESSGPACLQAPSRPALQGGQR